MHDEKTLGKVSKLLPRCCIAILLQLPQVQLANISYDSNNYFASPMNSHADVATHDNNRYVASTNAYIVNGPHHIYHNPGYVTT